MDKCKFKIGDEVKHYDYKWDALDHIVTGITDDGKILIDGKQEKHNADDYLFLDEPDTKFE